MDWELVIAVFIGVLLAHSVIHIVRRIAAHAALARAEHRRRMGLPLQ